MSHFRRWLASQASARPAYLPEADRFSFAIDRWRSIDTGGSQILIPRYLTHHDCLDSIPAVLGFAMR
ncbi:MAG: hypothetical protein K7J46_15975 [Bryobacter sp.]|jgi:hypothetical protein|nr:hypothetical protein [Bryobacter sp. CoA8 C33]